MTGLSFLHRLVLCILMLGFLTGWPAHAQAPTRIIFLHHSCGNNLIEQGDVRQGFTRLGYAFYDHGYNSQGLRLADGSYSGTNFAVPGDNTNPDGIATIFAQPLHDPPDNTFSHLMQYDVIAFKSCFPVSNIGSDDQLNAYKSYYRQVRDRMDQYPDKLFIVVTQPPQVPGSSNVEEARRARALADWLASDEFLSGHPNVFTFDFFGYLAGGDHFLRPEYRLNDQDAHPNPRANREIGPRFVDFIDQAIRRYAGGASRATPVPPTAPPPEPTSTPVPAVEEPTATATEAVSTATTEPPAATETPSPIVETAQSPAMIDDFEADDSAWGSSAEGADSRVECGPDAGRAHEGTRALRIAYEVVPGGQVDCGRSFESPRDWSEAEGVSMWVYTDGAVEELTLMVFSGDPDDPTPFEVALPLSSESVGGWSQMGFSWASFERAPWAAGGLDAIDPTRMIGYGFSLGAGDDVLWVDDVQLSADAAPPLVAPTATSTTAPTAATEEPPPVSTEASTEDAEAAGGLCPGAALAFAPLGLVGVLLISRAICRTGS